MTLHTKHQAQVLIILMIFIEFSIVILDEAALVKAAKEMGFVFHTRTPDSVNVLVVSWILNGVYRCYIFLEQ